MNITNIQDNEDDEDDKQITELINSLDITDDINNTHNRIKTIEDIKEECELNNQHFHIQPTQFDAIYDPQFSEYTDNYNKVCDNLLILKRMIKRKMFVNVQNKLLGSSRSRLINKFILPKPEIELSDIINFIHKLKTIRPLYQSAVYIDLCQDSKFYVGISNSTYLDNNIPVTDDNIANSRLADHRNNGGTIFPTNFTHMYPVINSLCSFFGDKDDEDLITILMSKSVGNSVRGGKWASPFIIPDYPNLTIQQIKQKLLDKILI